MPDVLAHPHARRRWIALAVVGVLVIGVIIAYPLTRNWLVRSRVAAVLDRAGIPLQHVNITSATPWHAQLDDLVAGSDRGLHIQQITVRYTPTELFQGHVDRITIDGAQVNASLLKHTRRPTSPGNTSQPTTGPSSGSTATPAFSSIEIRDSKLLVGTGDNRVALPFRATITTTGGAYAIDAQVNEHPKPVTLSLKVHGKAWSGSAECDALETANVQKLLQAFSIHAPDMTGWADTRVNVAFQNGQGTLSANLQPQAIQFTSSTGNKLNLESGLIEFGYPFQNKGAPAVLTMQSLNLNSSIAAVAANGISGTVTFTQLAPPTTPANQHISVTTLTSGKVTLHDGMILFHVEPTGNTVIEKTHWTGMGGEFSSSNAQVHADGSADLTVTAHDVALHELLGAFSSGLASGQGRVDATIPVHIDNGDVALGQGSITVQSGGSLQIHEAQRLADNIAKSNPAIASGAANANIRQDLPEALSDFQFTTLSVQLKKSDNGLMADVHLVGRGRVKQTHSYDLEFRISPINQALAIGLGLERILQGS